MFSDRSKINTFHSEFKTLSEFFFNTPRAVMYGLNGIERRTSCQMCSNVYTVYSITENRGDRRVISCIAFTVYYIYLACT